MEVDAILSQYRSGIPERYWDRIASTSIIKQIFSDRMFPLTIEGIDQAMRELNK